MPKRVRSVFTVLAISAALWVTGCPAVRERPAGDTHHSAVRPVNRDGESWAAAWTGRHEELNERLRRGRVDLLFVGDSITHYWEPTELWPRDGGEVWERYYGTRNAVNFAIAGDCTGHVLWRLEHGDFEHIAPRVAVVLIGTNNYRFNTEQQIADGIIAVVKTLRKHLPRTRVLLLAQFPRGEKPGDPARDVLARVSRLSAEIADGEWVHYLDISREFLDEDGRLGRDVMPDFLHLSEKGYAIWARAMEPKLKELLAGQNDPPSARRGKSHPSFSADSG